MRISAEIDYACRALLELALNYPGRNLVRVSAIAKKQDIPIKYLEQILIQLKSIGLVESVRGKEGGYALAQPPNRITLGKIVRHIGGALLTVANSSKKKDSVFVAIWRDLEETMARVLDKITFEDIANKTKGMGKAIVYQI